jgi:2-octaprenylphenol hydroxylase
MMEEIIVVGGGMVGLTCALAFVQQGFAVTIIEAQSSPIKSQPKASDAFDNRVVAISRASKQLFERCGVWSTIEGARSCAYQHMKVWDDTMDGKIHFSAMAHFEPELGHIIEQQVILGALWQKLADYPHVKYCLGTKPQAINHSAKHIEVVLSSGELIRAGLVIAADGANSNLRVLCGIASTGWDYQQQALVATVVGSLPHGATAFQRFASDGSLALLPLAEPFHSSIVWATQTSHATTLCEMEEILFNQILTRESQAVMGDLQLVGKRFTFPLRTHHAKQYVHERCVFVGDAAHTLHPLAGQGVNLGLLDVAALLEVVSRAKSKGRDFAAQAVLSRYQRRRKGHNQVMIWAMELFKRVFASNNSVVQRLRNIGLNFVDEQKALKQLFIKLAMGTF